MEFEMKPYGVYVKIDAENRITAINSSAFLADTDGWTLIDEGHGDKHHHAQGNYLDKPVIVESGIFRYKLVDGKPVERTQDEMDADYAALPSSPVSDSERIAQLEEALELILSGVTE